MLATGSRLAGELRVTDTGRPGGRAVSWKPSEKVFRFVFLFGPRIGRTGTLLAERRSPKGLIGRGFFRFRVFRRWALQAGGRRLAPLAALGRRSGESCFAHFVK